MSTASVERVEEARAVLERLERIEALERARADPSILLGELRELVREAETWAKRERDPRAVAAAETLGSQMTSATTEAADNLHKAPLVWAAHSKE